MIFKMYKQNTFGEIQTTSSLAKKKNDAYYYINDRNVKRNEHG